ncbi:TetR/AcrR family transcriptional regulator [Actinomadura livida]|uniref:AcrR family transcriptional regulator n=1 Tax=Actinomadura livida TaxID=79909 RepID=A0A7W7IIQ3_9ACTN|nr:MULTISPECIES: TetR/AcrR family transcriptional regulator [Actinomadura]MBB4777851.1 AcrR family transcriptional regulator [Actinomadura catellatispora]GGT98250.1 TetR family transcriptional regulator [Actinomadura livida]
MDRGPAGRSVDLELMRTPPPKERADAARNRVKVLEAAAAMFARHGVESVSMDAVAAAAGVGKGTLFRRFGDKAGLAVALLDERERELQDAILSGPSPLGPGGRGEAVPPAERLHAFADAYLDYVLEHLSLVRMSETASPGARYRIGAYGFWHRHVTILLDQIVADGDALAHALLAVLSAEHLTAMIENVGAERTRAAVRALFDVAGS